GTLYRHFPSKRALFLAVTLEGIARLRAELEAKLEIDGSPARKVARIVRHTLAYFWNRRFFLALSHQREHRRDGERERRRHPEQLPRRVRRTLQQASPAGPGPRGNARAAGE